MHRLWIVFGAVFGIAGTIAAAGAAHATGSGSLDVAAHFLLFHAPVLLVLPVLISLGFVHAKVASLGGWLLLAGVALFSGELALRALTGQTLFPMAAPTGGTLIILGWLITGLSALLARRARSA